MCQRLSAVFVCACVVFGASAMRAFRQVAAVAAQPSFVDDLDYAAIVPAFFGARQVPIVQQGFQMMQDGANKWR